VRERERKRERERERGGEKARIRELGNDERAKLTGDQDRRIQGYQWRETERSCFHLRKELNVRRPQGLKTSRWILESKDSTEPSICRFKIPKIECLKTLGLG